MTTTIQKWGNSQGIRIPKMILNDVNWSDSETIVVLVQGNKLIIEKAEEQEKENIKDLFKDYSGEYETTEIDWGEREGAEIW